MAVGPNGCTVTRGNGVCADWPGRKAVDRLAPRKLRGFSGLAGGSRMADDLPKLDLQEEFVALYVQHQVAIRSFVRTLLPAPADVEDVMQTASLTMWRRFEQFRPGTSFRNWAFQVTKFVAMKHVARKARDRHRFSEETMGLLAQHVEENHDRFVAQRRVLAHCVEQLSEGDRQVLSVCYTSGTTLKEFAEQLGRTPNAIYKQLGRIRAALVACVRRRLQTEGIA